MKKIYCKKCGNKILDSDADYCPRCGARINDNEEVQQMQKDKRTRNILIIALIIVIIASLLIMSAGFIMNQNQNKNTLLSNAKFALGDFETLSFSADLNPTRDYDYLSVEIEYYDNNNNIIDKTPIAWNQNNVKANQPIKINQPTVMSYYGKSIPTKAVIKVYDDVYSKEPIQTIEVNISDNLGNNTNNDTSSSTSNHASNNTGKTIYGYYEDGTPITSKSDYDNYMNYLQTADRSYNGPIGYNDYYEPPSYSSQESSSHQSPGGSSVVTTEA